MRKFDYSINSYHRTASINVDYAPFWVFWLDDLFNFLCGIVPPVPLPPIPIRLSDETSIELNDGKKWTTLRDWCGNLRSLFHCSVHAPIFGWCWGKTDSRPIEVDYKKAKKAFYDKDREFWDEQEKVGRRLRRAGK